MRQDARTIVLEGTLAGEKGFYDCPILLKVFGPSETNDRAELEAKLKHDKVPLKKRNHAAPKVPKQPVEPPSRKPLGYTSSQASSQSSSQPEPVLEIRDFIQTSERFNPRDAEQMVERYGASEDVLSKMPMADQPEKLQSTLLPYQRQGLAWMLEKENPVLPAPGSQDIVQLWKRDPHSQNRFQNIATQFSTTLAPVLARGGILADDMGLGKTLQVISTILEGGPGTTLIVAPVSVMSNVSYWGRSPFHFFPLSFDNSSKTFYDTLLGRLSPESMFMKRLLTPPLSSGPSRWKDTSRRNTL